MFRGAFLDISQICGKYEETRGKYKEINRKYEEKWGKYENM